MPYLANLYFQAAWLCNPSKESTMGLVIGYKIQLWTMFSSLLWQIIGAAITLQGMPSVYAYAILNHPERFGMSISQNDSRFICNDETNICVHRNAIMHSFRQTDIITNIAVYLFWLIWFSYWFAISLQMSG